MKKIDIKNVKKCGLIGLIMALALLFASCYTPCPLYGTWYTYDGSSSIKFTDTDFTANISLGEDKTDTTTGEWSVFNDTLVLKPTEGKTRYVKWGFTEKSYGTLLLMWETDGVPVDIRFYLGSK